MSNYVDTENKDFRKGAKDARKAIKKLDLLSKETVRNLMAKAENRTANSLYLSGYCDTCRQEIMRIA